jgi:secreted Zn-dependent insulinase-like peptidase
MTIETVVTKTTATGIITAAAAVSNRNDNSKEQQLKQIQSLQLVPLPQPIQGQADWRSYSCFTIPTNDITVCCVHDPNSKTTAVATTINVGAASDPISLPGLART